jgi:SAM-dependent methyltransferase
MGAWVMLKRQYVKLCDVQDFADPELQRLIAELVPGATGVHRKHWELARAALFLQDVNAARNGAAVLDVGAGQDRLLYWLANRVRRIVAVDLYGEGEWASGEADVAMLANAAAFAPFPYREEALEVRHMDARQLEFPDASFDAVVSLSSIEHFGGPAGIRRAATEIGRVLKPGGHAFVVTECFVSRHPFNSPLVQTAVRLTTLNRRARAARPRRRMEEVLTWREIVANIIRPSGLRLMQPFDRSLTPGTFANVVSILENGRLVHGSGSGSLHILLRARGAPFTSVALALEKPGALPPGR